MTREPGMITAVEIAESNGVDPKVFRTKLRKEKLEWHARGDKWTVPTDGPQHADMERVMSELMSSLGVIREQ